MDGVKISASIDASDWLLAMDRFVVIQHQEGTAASKASAELIADRTREVLTMQWHGKGTRTPSVPGTPPAAISGELAASLVVSEAGDGAYEVGPTAKYAREQELGGPMQGHPLMHWFEEGIEYFSKHHDLPARPYFRPSSDSAIESGEVTDIYQDHWLQGQREATA